MWSAIKNMALRMQGRRIVGVDFSNGFKQTFVEQEGGAFFTCSLFFSFNPSIYCCSTVKSVHGT
jgi:hypothetical protein